MHACASCAEFLWIEKKKVKRVIKPEREKETGPDGEMEPQIQGLDVGFQISWLSSDEDGELFVV